MDAVAQAPEDADDEQEERPKKETVRFFVVGDIGEPGPWRAAVADAMASLQRSNPGAAFVLTTGDNSYKSAGFTDAAFESLEREMLSKVRLPWFLCLGNHDVTGGGWAWHAKHARPPAGDERRSRHDRDLRCPAPAYTLPAEVTGDFLTIVVVNTNRLSLGMPRPATAPAPEFYASSSRDWWGEQKAALSNVLARADDAGRWGVVVGHHPAEYAAVSEHRIPVVRYFSSTFMRGGLASHAARPRRGLAHVLRRQADWYLCGHQHLMAHMMLRPSRSRPAEETRCHFAIVGNSSKTEQDLGDFDDDSPASAPAGLGSWLASSLGASLGLCAGFPAKMDVTFGKSITGQNGSLLGLIADCTAKMDESIGKSNTGQNRRYAEQWTDTDNVGFAKADVSRSQFKMAFYRVPKGQREAVLAHQVMIERR